MTDKVMREINVLLLGQTGVGKSTLINAFANYEKYKTFREAIGKEETCLIPTKFPFYGSDLNDITTINAGPIDDPNENLEQGQSGTFSCRSYLFNFEERGLKIRFIDSSGFADTRGSDKDNQNLEDVLNFVTQYHDIHAFAVVTKADSTRENYQLQVRYQNLFERLGTASLENVILIFTHGHKPESLSILTSTFRNICDNLNLQPLPEFKKKSIFCFENKPFRDLLEINRKLKSKNDCERDSEHSWGKSRNEFHRLIEEVEKISPFAVGHLIKQQDERTFIRDVSVIAGTILKTPNYNLIKAEECRNVITVCFSEACINKFPSAAHNPNQRFENIICCEEAELWNQNKKTTCFSESCDCEKSSHEYLFFKLSEHRVKSDGTTPVATDYLTRLKREKTVMVGAIQFLIKYIENDEKINSIPAESCLGLNRSSYKSLLKRSIQHLNAENSVPYEEFDSITRAEGYLRELETFGKVLCDVRDFSNRGKEIVKKLREIVVN